MTEWPSDSYRIFISYAREDGIDTALRLRNDLTAAGHDTWLDLAEIAAGASWARDIEEAIEGCDIALILLSHGSYVSDICRGEQLRALRKGKRVIPILIQPDADRPLHLEHLNYVDFSHSSLYDQRFADLLNYIVTGQNPPPPLPMLDDPGGMETARMPPVAAPAMPMERKRDARAFRRYLADLRDEPWLGERHWWTYFLFYYSDVQDIAAVLEKGAITPPPRSKRRPDLWDHSVRLNFRPRTPDLWGGEGIRPKATRPAAHVPVPVYLLFDLESVITLPEARFSDGDVTQTRRTSKSATAFRDMPFDLIYHDSWLRQEERDEILRARRAQVILPQALPLNSLGHIICRSAGERETLLNLLSHHAHLRWQQKAAVRPEYNLFNNKWVYVQSAMLSPEGVYIAFNPCEGGSPEECEPFDIRAEVESAAQQAQTIELPDVSPGDNLALDLTDLKLSGGYRLRLYLDNALAYVGSYSG